MLPQVIPDIFLLVDHSFQSFITTTVPVVVPWKENNISLEMINLAEDHIHIQYGFIITPVIRRGQPPWIDNITQYYQ